MFESKRSIVKLNVQSYTFFSFLLHPFLSFSPLCVCVHVCLPVNNNVFADSISISQHVGGACVCMCLHSQQDMVYSLYVRVWITYSLLPHSTHRPLWTLAHFVPRLKWMCINLKQVWKMNEMKIDIQTFPMGGFSFLFLLKWCIFFFTVLEFYIFFSFVLITLEKYNV